MTIPTSAALTEEPPFDEADPIGWLLANAPKDQPTKPPEPRLTQEETADFFVSHVNALAWAAKSEHTRLSALYTIGRTYGYPFIADRILDLTVGVKSEAVKLSALNVIGRSLGALQPPSSIEPPKPEPTEPGYDLIRLFESDLNELQELTTCPLPGRPGPPVDVDAYLDTLDQAYSPHTFQLPTPEELAADLAAEYKKIAEAPPPKPPDNLETASALEVGAYLVARFPDNPGARSFAERHGLPVPPAPPSLRNPDDGRPSHVDAPDGPQVFATTWSQAEHEAFINDFANFPPPLPADLPYADPPRTDSLNTDPFAPSPADSDSNPAAQPPKPPPPATESERTPFEQMLAEYAAQIRSEHNWAALRAEAAGLPPPPPLDPRAALRAALSAPPRAADAGGFPSPYDDPFAPPYTDPYPPRRKLTRRQRELAAHAEADEIDRRLNAGGLERALAIPARPQPPASQWRHPFAPPDPEPDFRLFKRLLAESQDAQPNAAAPPGAPAAPKPPSTPSRNPVPSPRNPSPRLPTPRLPRTLRPLDMPDTQPPAEQEPPPTEQPSHSAERDPQPAPAQPGEPPTPKQTPQRPHTEQPPGQPPRPPP